MTPDKRIPLVTESWYRQGSAELMMKFYGARRRALLVLARSGLTTESCVRADL